MVWYCSTDHAFVKNNQTCTMNNITKTSDSTAFTYRYVGSITLVGILLSIIIVISGPKLTIAGVLLILVVMLSWVKPSLYLHGLLVIALALPAGFTTTQIFSVRVGDYNILFTDVLLGIMVLRWMLGQLIIKSHPRGVSVISQRLAAIISVLLAYSLVALLRGLIEYGRFNLSIYDARPIFYYIVILIAFDYLQAQRSVAHLPRSILIGLFLYSVFILSYFFAPVGHPLSIVQEENSWAFANRIGFTNGTYFLLGVPLSIWLLIDRSISYWAKFWIISVLVSFLAVIVLSMSRTTAVGLVLAIIFSFIVYNRNYGRRVRISTQIIRLFVVSTLILIAIPIVTELVLPLVLGETSQFTIEVFVRRFDFSSAAMYESHIAPRIVMLRTAAELILQNPVLGYGFGYQFSLWGWSAPVTFIDNSFITIWIRLGVIGLFILLTIILQLFRAIRRVLRYLRLHDAPFVRALVVSLAGAAPALLIVSLNASWLVTSSAVIPLLIIAGSVIGYSARVKSGSYR